MLALPTLPVGHHAQLLPPDPGDVRVCASIGPSGEALALWAANPEAATQSSLPVRARISTHTAATTSSTPIDWRPSAHPMIQPLPDGRVLVVAARCQWRHAGPEQNAVTYDSTGQVCAEQTLGDGIEHVLSTRQGDVWVGYFDEGVFGNLGWSGTTGPSPLGAAGLVRYDTELTARWHYPSHSLHPWGAISDCYALNVTDDATWTCYYRRFPVVRIQDDTLTWWHNDIRGAKALAVDGSRVALYGGGKAAHDRLATGVLETEGLRVTGEYRLVLPGGEPMPFRAQVIGRGADLHVVLNTGEWLRLGLDEVPAESDG
ncbi:hypothetical protein EV191_110130 [Tamaricihabitans halophyticus]|uniref:Uncharacterized protein n=2 Tax=Tamaricihabitans halophyticus TaxID=1262583 RepID=A0A4R2QH41_9PSEU|nr:hypothetical protein EV191_110130 [Tamaricihabitans halophyticus]